ncbi:unnamed protein product [Heterobilharzia americana]|nr:unnamed protein product [Heterobilharzia americana]CAH8455101.1 unnamed protein product [Heterobilharzia americana]
MDLDPIPLAYHVIAGIVDISGTICNIFTLIFISFTHLGSRTATILFRTQCSFDGLTCFFAAISLFSSPHITNFTGWFAVFICHVWISEYFFKFIELLNVSNLMWISIDRLFAVYLRSSYKTFQKIEPFICYTFILCHAIITPLPVVFTVNYTNGTCTRKGENTNPAYEQFSVYSWLIFAYLIPSITMVICYSHVYYFIQKSLAQSRSTQQETYTTEIIKQSMNTVKSSQQKCSSSSISSAVSTSSSISQIKSVLLSITIMCTLFVLSHSYYHIYSLAGLYGAIQYETISIQRRLAVFFTVIKSSLNPVILLVSSQQLRKKLIKAYYKFSYRMKLSKKFYPSANTIETSMKSNDNQD